MRRFNDWLAEKITAAVGTMWAAWLFLAIAMISLPAAVASHNMTVLIAWLSSNALQLILLPIIIVGQNLQGQRHDEHAAKLDAIHEHLGITPKEDAGR